MADDICKCRPNLSAVSFAGVAMSNAPSARLWACAASPFAFLAEVAASRALEFASLISWSEMDCKWPEKINTPASPANSPKRLMATIQTNMNLGSLVHLIHPGSFPCSSRYSPAAPCAKTSPHTRSSNSQPLSQCSVVDLDREKKYPISPYRPLGGLGVFITGLAASCIFLMGRLRHDPGKRRPSCGDPRNRQRNRSVQAKENS